MKIIILSVRDDVERLKVASKQSLVITVTLLYLLFSAGINEIYFLHGHDGFFRFGRL